MKIERNNYEMFFLDYFENALAAEKVAELFLFLENNPDLKKEFDSYASTEIPSISKTVFNNKDALKKPVVDMNNVEEFMLRSVDNDLSNDEQVSLDNFLNSNPIAKKEYDLLCKTKLKPNNVFYADKLNLRKNGLSLCNYQTYLIADLEGDLNAIQQEELKQFIASHSELQNDKNLFLQTVLRKESIEFPEKNSLKKSVPLYAFNYKYLSGAVAACLLILLGVWFYNPEDVSSPEFATEVQVQNEEQSVSDHDNTQLAEEESNLRSNESITSEVPEINDQLANDNRINLKPRSTFGIKTIFSQNLLACSEVELNLPSVSVLEQNSNLSESITFSKPDTEMLALINEFYGDPSGTISNEGNTQLATLAKNNLSRMADDSYVASTVLADDKKGGRKIFELVASGVSKITKDKMQLNGRFNDQDRLVAYRLQSNRVNLKNKY